MLRVFLLSCLLSSGICLAQAPVAVLPAAEAAKILPATVFFRGLSAPVQGRNSGGVRFADKGLMLVALVDTSGYSSQVQEKYQAYLITESALEIDGHRLPPGAYGCGFIAGDTFIVQDLGAHDLFTARSERDAGLRRPTPLQVLAAPGAEGGYRLYAGRSYIGFKLAGN
jgi:hypothetical protein